MIPSVLIPPSFVPTPGNVISMFDRRSSFPLVSLLLSYARFLLFRDLWKRANMVIKSVLLSLLPGVSTKNNDARAAASCTLENLLNPPARQAIMQRRRVPTSIFIAEGFYLARFSSSPRSCDEARSGTRPPLLCLSARARLPPAAAPGIIG